MYRLKLTTDSDQSANEVALIAQCLGYRYVDRLWNVVCIDLVNDTEIEPTMIEINQESCQFDGTYPPKRTKGKIYRERSAMILTFEVDRIER